jgi:RNA polymerase sigma factor (sigma-70 family)
VTYFQPGEARLLERFRQGERRALEEVYRTYVDSVARTVAGTLRLYGRRNWRQVAAELPDLVQDVFARAFEPQTRRRFDGIRDYWPYLAQITRNVVVDHLRREGRQITVPPALFADETMLHADPAQSADGFGDPQTMALVGNYLAQLPPELRRVHEALYVRGLSQREAAVALGLGRQAIRTLEARLRDGLRIVLQKVGDLDLTAALDAAARIRVSGREKAR